MISAQITTLGSKTHSQIFQAGTQRSSSGGMLCSGNPKTPNSERFQSDCKRPTASVFRAATSNQQQ
jgi:hypothetical protein